MWMPYISLKYCLYSFFQICRECFYIVFEDEIHQTIVENSLFKAGERVAIGASGGKGKSRFGHAISW